jgi:hypothetical protein
MRNPPRQPQMGRIKLFQVLSEISFLETLAPNMPPKRRDMYSAYLLVAHGYVQFTVSSAELHGDGTFVVP